MLGVVTVSITRDKPLEPDLDQPISALHVGAEDWSALMGGVNNDHYANLKLFPKI